ncbi:hypothetical protein H4582DRAFT_2114401 [Lactarius indigo]|nr:hypothetical protein H4582DRAFT_2114401 [Lactarius indigo]
MQESMIPNCGLGTVEHRHITRVFFPALYNDAAQPVLTSAQLAQLYDECIRPAVMQVIPSHASHWPVDYKSAIQQAKDTTGRLHLGSIAVPSMHLVPFCSALIQRLGCIDAFKGAYFCHELRGLKGGTAHEEGGQQPEEAFETFFDNVDMRRLDPSNWLVDVGLEVYDPGMVVKWSKFSHSAILKYILPTLEPEEIQALQGRRTFHLDNVAQLDDFAGFRCEPGQFGTRHGVEYINVYTTDKCPTYQLHTGLWRRRYCGDLFPKKLEKLLADLLNMSTTYKSCCGNSQQPAQEGCARLEIRVPMKLARNALRDPPHDLLRSWTISVSPNVWW